MYSPGSFFTDPCLHHAQPQGEWRSAPGETIARNSSNGHRSQPFLGLFSLGLSIGMGVWGMMITVVRAEHSPASPTETTELQAETTNKSLTPIRLQLKWKHQFQFAGYYAAKAKGYYQQAGLDVTFLEAQETIEPAQMVIQGKAEMGITNSDLLLLRSRGNPVVALAAIYQHSPLILLALEKSGIDNIHQLAGKRIMLESHADELLAYLKKEGISSDEIVKIPHSFNPSDLIEGKVAAMSAYLTDEPFVLAQQGIAFREFSPRASGIDFYGDVLFTTETMIRQHPDQVRAFLDASLLGWQYALNHPQEIIDLILREYSQRHSRAQLTFEAQASRQLIMPEVVEIGYMNPGRWQAIAETYKELGLLGQYYNPHLIGFLYDRNPPPPWLWIYGGFLGAGSLICSISFVAFRFYRLQRSLQQEVKERQAVEVVLMEEKQRFYNLVEHAPFPVLISRLDSGKILYANSQMAQKVEVAANFLPGKSTLEFYANPQDRHTLTERLAQQGYIENYEVLWKTATNKAFWACISSNLIQWEQSTAALTALMDVTEQYQFKQHLENLAMTDELTGLHNRRYFLAQGNLAFQEAEHYGNPLSILMIDVDHFKQVNDTYGHELGDQVLKHIATLFQSVLRQADLLGRLGGEEFALILPDTPSTGALHLAEHLRHLVEVNPYQSSQWVISLTVSIGLKTKGKDTPNLQALLIQADQALYEAKTAGRNCVINANV